MEIKIFVITFLKRLLISNKNKEKQKQKKKNIVLFNMIDIARYLVLVFFGPLVSFLPQKYSYIFVSLLLCDGVHI